MITARSSLVTTVILATASAIFAQAESFTVTLRRQQQDPAGKFSRVNREETWQAAEIAIIVCDVWDYHHCLNAVRRLAEFAPRLNQVLTDARRRGMTIIHSPSDCMPAYEDHPARRRAMAVPLAKTLPAEIRTWCSRIPAEEQAAYPVDQSDGGEDDDPREHAQWSAKLVALARNPAMPWQTQSPLITIDGERDYISDRGDEVWSILQHRGIKQVILTGVHANMCVLGRPFGLRQLVRNDMPVALMRDMTDSMYNPRRWPYVDHFTGHDLVISHIERYVCPTLTSDQFLGGEPFRWKNDDRQLRDVAEVQPPRLRSREDFESVWSVISLPTDWKEATGGVLKDYAGTAWYRCVVRVPEGDVPTPIVVDHEAADGAGLAWLNGHALTKVRAAGHGGFAIDSKFIAAGDANLLVLRVEHTAGDHVLRGPPLFLYGDTRMPLKGRWQFRLGDDSNRSNMPLPAKFGAATDIVFEVKNEKAAESSR